MNERESEGAQRIRKKSKNFVRRKVYLGLFFPLMKRFIILYEEERKDKEGKEKKHKTKRWKKKHIKKEI